MPIYLERWDDIDREAVSRAFSDALDRELDKLMNRKIPREEIEKLPRMEEPECCAYCGEMHGRVNFVVIGTPGSITMHKAWIHPECERGYLRMIDDPELRK